ncbi:hypothetical protein PSYJA_45906, partial [Pseudomonas syringae pv. japonica str. M301072]
DAPRHTYAPWRILQHTRIQALFNVSLAAKTGHGFFI